MSDIVIRIDRLGEIEAFIAALDEWGTEDPELRHAEIIRYLQSPLGLTQYLERETEEVTGHA